MSSYSTDIHRRHFLAGSLAALASSACPNLSAAQTRPNPETQSYETDPTAQEFWKNLGGPRQNALFENWSPGHGGNMVKQAYELDKANEGLALENQGRGPVFYCAVDPTKSSTWKLAHAVGSSVLLDDVSNKGATLQLLVNGLKLSNKEHASLGTIENGSLRIDIGQTKPLVPTIGNLVWTAMAAIVPGAEGKLPQAQSVNFDPGTVWGNVQKVPLPGGGGSLLWNFFLNKKPSELSQFLNWIRGNSASIDVVLPLLGLPGYVLSAFTTLNKIIGAIPQNPTFLFKQGTWSDGFVACTKQIAQTFPYSFKAIRLINGAQYVVVPEGDNHSFYKAITAENYKLSDGWIVKRGEENFAEDAATQHLKDVTYLTLTVGVSLGLG